MSETNVRGWEDRELLELAKRQRQLIWIFLGGILLFVLIGMAAGWGMIGGLGRGEDLFALLWNIALIVQVYRVAQSARLKAWLYALLMLVPLVNLLVFFHISAKASSILKENGIGVGLMGAKGKDLKRLGVAE